MLLKTFKPAVVVVVSLLAIPNHARAESPGGGDGDPGVVDVPPALSTHPVLVALENAPFCETVPDWTVVMKSVDAPVLRTAIEDGTVTWAHLARSIAALAAIGSSADLQILWDQAEDLSWEYLVEVVDPLATDQEVFVAQDRLLGSIRRSILVAWETRGDLPPAIIQAGLQDPDPRVRRNAARLALMSGSETLVAKGLDACAFDPAVAAVAYICP